MGPHAGGGDGVADPLLSVGCHGRYRARVGGGEQVQYCSSVTDGRRRPLRVGKSAAEVAHLQHERSVRLDQGQEVVEDVVPAEGHAVAVDRHWAGRVGVDAPDLGHREHSDGVEKWRRRSQRGDQAVASGALSQVGHADMTAELAPQRWRERRKVGEGHEGQRQGQLGRRGRYRATEGLDGGGGPVCAEEQAAPINLGDR